MGNCNSVVATNSEDRHSRAGPCPSPPGWRISYICLLKTLKREAELYVQQKVMVNLPKENLLSMPLVLTCVACYSTVLTCVSGQSPLSFAKRPPLLKFCQRKKNLCNTRFFKNILAFLGKCINQYFVCCSIHVPAKGAEGGANSLVLRIISGQTLIIAQSQTLRWTPNH